MIYIYAAGIKGGFIFPSDDMDLNSSEEGGNKVYVKAGLSPSLQEFSNTTMDE
jgi:hypothetical protein